MLTLESLAPGTSLVGVDPTLVVTVVAVVPIGEGAVQLVYKTADGTLKDRLLTRADEASISIATVERPWSFDGSGEDFKLAVEAKPSLLPRQPLRYVLADDPGAGKTVMAGLYIRELLMRADARRILIVAPGSLVEQWRDELYETLP